ncbi:MAG: hypothetical protein GY936_13130 [Ignavibacteriae bacterium]|nr:hypothetical protein [Ignavibacteriota bacterium]
MSGEKLNPHFYKDEIFFVNNYYKIYKINSKFSNKAEVVLETEHDLRIPKRDNSYLYFIEIINSEYLLKRIHLGNMNNEILTNKGVVYNYDFLKSNLVLSYSDFNTPRCISILDLDTKLVSNISGGSHIINGSFKFTKPSPISSPSFIYSPESSNPKGLIIYLHPGLHSDFSPRWDTILMTLVKNGYKIFAPNYPMSSGYGKNYFSSSFSSAVTDILKLKEHLKLRYNNTPLFFISASSGNILMENILARDKTDVNSSISLFGLPGIKPQNNTLYILGTNDPLVNFSKRTSQLKEYQTDNNRLTIETYSNEGHWFRRKENIKDVVVKILNYLDNAKNM